MDGRILKHALGAAIVFAVAASVPPLAATSPATGTNRVVRQAPLFVLPRLGRPGTLSLESLRGKAVVLVFWSSYNPGYQKEAVRLENLWRHWRSRGVVFVGVDEQDFPGDALASIRHYKISYPQVSDSGNSAVAFAYSPGADEASVPSLSFVNRAGGLVRDAGVGASDAELASRIQSALGSSAPAGAVIAVVAGQPSEFAFTLSRTSIPTGRVTFNITNKGALPHVLKICPSNAGGRANDCPYISGSVTSQIPPGGVETLVVDFTRPGTYEYLCPLKGHAALGMKGDLKVT